MNKESITWISDFEPSIEDFILFVTMSGGLHQGFIDSRGQYLCSLTRKGFGYAEIKHWAYLNLENSHE